MLDTKLQNRILSFIGKNRFGCSSTDISKKLKVNRLTMAKYLSSMHTNGSIDFKKMGMAKVWYAEKSPLLGLLKNKNKNNSNSIKTLLDSFSHGAIVVDKSFRIIWANKEWEKTYGRYKNKVCYSMTGKTNVCPECPVVRSFETGLVEKRACRQREKEEIKYIEAIPIKDSEGKVVAAIEFSNELSIIDAT